jgi:hypothetical protein
MLCQQGFANKQGKTERNRNGPEPERAVEENQEFRK